MPREKEGYRDELEELVKFFSKGEGDHLVTKRVLTASDVARYTGRDRHWCREKYNINPKKGITIVALARALS